MVTLSAIVFLISPGTYLASPRSLTLINGGKLNMAATMSTLMLTVIIAAVGRFPLSHIACDPVTFSCGKRGDA